MNELAIQKEQVIDYEKKALEYLDAMGMTKQLSESQKKQFIELASAYQLNPFKREIYPIVYKNKMGGNDMNLVTGYEVYIQRANQSGLLDGWTWQTDGEIKFKTDLRTTKDGRDYQTKTIDKEKSNLQATVTIYRKDWSHPFVHSITIDEFSGESGIWLQSPKFMLKKTAASQAFRLCFSKELSGIPYTSEETTTFKTYLEMSPAQEIKEQPQISALIETEDSNISDDSPEELLPIVKEICLLAEDLFQKQFLTDKKKQNIIEKAKDPSTTNGLHQYLIYQLSLFQRLYALTEQALITENEKVELYKAILSAKSQELKELDKTLNSIELNKEVA